MRDITTEVLIAVTVIHELKMLYELQEGLSTLDKEIVLLERINALENALSDYWSNRVHTITLKSLRQKFKYTKAGQGRVRRTQYVKVLLNYASRTEKQAQL